MEHNITSIYFSYYFWNYFKGLNTLGSQDQLFERVAKEFNNITDKEQLCKSVFFRLKKEIHKK